ncbi:Rhodanese domain protein [Talaromyces stipitatus ATCC 10500]|uniref:Rhodanese domain protein n=1 Tax=Talaromyces stipitatus (strain ATCC 10500 / CBS 375.48 / QM 6759 / NRRL 1006) TaxID=441959 RepID=B8MFI7_TALSN|nr:Rhodanese domain protein [Talaromyces stipitatus ATCC 10500]EED16721.1 Rhodanese domain protein [Talaromyces stipitatus ATCC 10500]
MSANVAVGVARRGARSVFGASAFSRSSSFVFRSRNIQIASQRVKNFSTERYQLLKIQYCSPQHYQSRFNLQQQQQHRKYSSENAPVFKQIGFDDINTKLSLSPSSTPSNIILIDVREPAELAATGIIPGAVSVPLASQPDAYFLPPEEFETRFGYTKPGFEQSSSPETAGKEKKEIIFYCKAGVRAQAAAQLAVQAGYDPDTLGVYRGSWLDWTNKGGKVEKWEGND